MEKFLLHTCCAPCSIAIIDELKDKFDLTVFFYNPNIYPEQEYLKRKKEVIRVCQKNNITLVDMDYEFKRWGDYIRGLEKEPEGGFRCVKCLQLRLDKAAHYAKENKFDYFATSLSSGRNKSAKIIDSIGEALSVFYGIKYFPEDWKTGGRQEKAKSMIEKMDIYRQNYCGCIYSMKK